MTRRAHRVCLHVCERGRGTESDLRMTDRLKAHCVWDVQVWGDNWDVKGLGHYQRNVIPNPYHFLLYIFGKQNELFTAVLCSSGCFSDNKKDHFYHRDCPWSTCKVIREESYKVCYFAAYTGSSVLQVQSNRTLLPMFFYSMHTCAVLAYLTVVLKMLQCLTKDMAFQKTLLSKNFNFKKNRTFSHLQ